MHDDKSGKEHYAKYDDLKLASTNDSNMPSYEPPKEASKEAKQADKAKPVNFHVQNVRHRIICDECGKPRAIVSAKKPKPDVLKLLEAYCEMNDYVCGAKLVPDDHPLA